MNCKPGDLAVIVYDDECRDEGKLIRCVTPEFRQGNWGWVFEPLSRGLPDPATVCINDRYLRPLRALNWAGLPEKVAA